MKKDTLVKGTMIAYICLMITKILGAIYVIPFYSIIGESGGVLYSYAYNIYNVFCDISISGIPVAISIIISEYIALKKINSEIKAYLVAKRMILIISIVLFLIMFIFAGPIANFFAGSVKDAFPITDIILVIRVISLCLLVIPYISVVKGYFEAHKYSSISSYSRVLEQIIRITIILIGSYTAINVLHYKVSIGVSIALFGGFIGALVALLYLRHKEKKYLKIDEVGEDTAPKTKDLVKTIAMVAVPLIIVSISTSIYNLTDIKLITEGLIKIGYESDEVGVITSIIATWVPKICVLITAIASGLLTTIIPNTIESYAKNDIKGLNKTFQMGLNTVFFVAIPSAICLYSYSWAVYYLFYGMSEYGGYILRFGVIINILYCFLLVSNTILQSMKKYKIIYINVIIGFIVNAILDIPLMYLFNNLGLLPFLGAQTATIIGNLTSITILIIYFRKKFKFTYQDCKKCISKMAIPTIFLVVLTWNCRNFVVLEHGYLITLISIGIPIIISIILYLYLLYRNGCIEDIFGKQAVTKLEKIFIFKNKKKLSK